MISDRIFLPFLLDPSTTLYWLHMSFIHKVKPTFVGQSESRDFVPTVYSCVLNTNHTVLGDMPDFYQKLVCITRHVIQFYQRPGWNTEHTNSLLMWQWHHFCFEVTREGLRPGWNCRHGKLFTQRPGWNKRILRKIQCVLNKSPRLVFKTKK